MKIKVLILITLLVGLLALVYIACNKSTPTQPQAKPVPAQTEVAKPAEINQPVAVTPIKPPSVSIAASGDQDITLSMSGAIFTTDANCTGVNVNIFDKKEDVYIDGGPAHPGAAGLPEGEYYVKVTTPDGDLLGTSGDAKPVVVDANGEFHECYQLWAILKKASDGTQGYDNTTNEGGEYKVWVSQNKDFPDNESKTDNFKVKKEGCTPNVPPTFDNCTDVEEDLGCNPASVPECDPSVTAQDNCGPVDVTCEKSDAVDGCKYTRTITYTATNSVGTSTCVKTYTWTEDTEAPELNGCPDPDGGTYQCLSEVPDPPTVTATDNCDTDVPVVPTEEQSNPGSNCHNTITRTWTATDDCGNSASCTQTILVNDDTKPTVQCPGDMTVYLNVGDPCPPVVTFEATGEDNCSGTVTVSCNPPSGSTFPVGTTTVTCTAMDACENVSDPCTFTVTVYSAVCALKFYDANANGSNDDGQVVAGWKFNLSGNGSQFTGSDGKTCFTGLGPGSYIVTEVAPNTKWVATNPTSQTVELGCPTTVEFGNVCLGAGGGLTLGYWSNKNGQAILQRNDPAWRNLLNALCLKKANGSDYDVPGGSFSTAYSDFRTWLLNANAVNMAYMLSAQLAAMELNVNFGSVNGSSLVYAPGCGGFITVNELMDAANSALCNGASRSEQECLKNALDNANNNKNFVQPYPCPFTSPY